MVQYSHWRFAPSTLIPLIAATLLLPAVNAQQATVLNPTQVPACALQCPVLLAADQQCVPPFRPTTNQQVYNACFCNSDYLTAFKAGQTAGFCQGICDAEEANAILTWFRGTVCANAVATAAGTTTAGAAAATSTSARTTTAGQGTATTGTNISAASRNNGTGRSWISENYGWVIFVIIMVFATILAVWLGCWWKKRKERRHRNDPNYRSSMIVANEVAASLSNKHPVASQPMGQTVQSEPTMEQRQSMGKRPSSSSWQGGAAGVGTAGFGAAAIAGPSNRPNSSHLRRENLGVRSRSDMSMSPISTPGVPEYDAPTPLSMSDRPLLGTPGARSPPPLPAAARRSPGRLQKSMSDSRRRSYAMNSPSNEMSSSASRPATAR